MPIATTRIWRAPSEGSSCFDMASSEWSTLLKSFFLREIFLLSLLLICCSLLSLCFSTWSCLAMRKQGESLWSEPANSRHHWCHPIFNRSSQDIQVIYSNSCFCMHITVISSRFVTCSMNFAFFGGMAVIRDSRLTQVSHGGWRVESQLSTADACTRTKYAKVSFVKRIVDGTLRIILSQIIKK